MLFHLLFSTLSNQAQAVPLQITQQGRMLDPNGSAIDGSHLVIFRMYNEETGGTVLWDETLTVQFNNGYYATVLGVDEVGNPLDSETLSLYPVYLEIQFDSNLPMSPRQKVNSAPYAQIAGVAESVDGGTVNASEVQIGSIPVIDGNRNWVGEPITVDWSQVQSIPSDLQDGDNDTQLNEGEVENFVTNGGLSLHEDTTLNGEQILTLGMDSDTLADISCSDGDVPKWDGVVGQWECGLDNDTLAGLNCSAGELAKFDGSNWNCGEDIDTVLDADTVISYVEQNSLSIPAGSQIDGADILTSADTLEPEWTDIQNRPNGLDDGDDDTQLSQSEVVGYVENGSVNLAQGSQVNSRNIVGQPSVCTNGQVLVYNSTTSDWECGDDTDTTLTPSEMQAAVEAMSLNLHNLPQVNGEYLLTESSVLNPNNIDASSSSDGQVLTSNNGLIDWSSMDGGCTMVSYSGENFSIDCDGVKHVIARNTGYIDVSPSGNFICAIKLDGSLSCWGSGSAVSGRPSGKFIKVYSSPNASFACALDETSAIHCWGQDLDGRVSEPSGYYEQVTVGSATCALASNGYVNCWGSDTIVNNIPNDTFLSISSHAQKVCGITTSNSILCWGENASGNNSFNYPSGTYLAISSGWTHDCAIDINNEIVCWGSGNYGITNPPEGTYKDIYCGENHCCSISDDNNVSCWGHNGHNQTEVPEFYGEIKVFNIGVRNGCFILEGGVLDCFGDIGSHLSLP